MKKTNKCFAAANSFNGFKNYFSEVLDTKSLQRLFIIKGGPGTGKSSLMKSFSNSFNDVCQTELIYCSSDPDSLDGIILEKNDKRVAFVDGTAPHNIDVELAGCRDELVDLGKGWDERVLTYEGDKIQIFSAEKKRAYQTAYMYLGFAGGIDKEIRKIILGSLKFREFNEEIIKITNDCSISLNATPKIRLKSAFCKKGLLNIDSDTEVNNYKLSGDEYSSRAFILFLSNTLKANGIFHIKNLFPLDTDLCDSVIIPEAGIKVGLYNDGEEINCERFLNDAFKLDRERIRVANEIKNEMLTESQRWLNIASDFHFRLEDIYTRAMDFKKNDAICEELTHKVNNILEL